MDYCLALLMHVPKGLKITPEDLERLLDPHVDPRDKGAVLHAMQSAVAKSFLKENPDWSETSAQTLELSLKHGICWSRRGYSDYPVRWTELSRQPVVFNYQGSPCWLTHPMLAVVGSRTPLPDTLLWMRRELSEFLRHHRVGIVSGGARGVDQWAHRLALDCKRPTVCMFPSGLLNPYPFGQEALWQQVVAGGGALVSTCGLAEPMRKSYFHIRNRWIAGLGEICFVAEANRRSGSHLTAKLAQEENRDLATLPVFPLAHQGLANLDLISDGAVLLRDARDLTTLWNRSCPAALQSSKS